MPEGVGVARVLFAKEEPPRLTLCEFRSTPESAGQSSLLAELASSHDLGQCDCTSVIPANDVQLLLIDTPEVAADELKAAVRWKIKDLVHFHIDDAVIDVFDIPGQEERGRQKMMYVAAARTATVQEHIDLLEGAGVALSVIDIPELAMRNVASLLPENQNGVALLYLSRQGGLLTLCRQDTLFLSRVFEFGSQQLSQQIEAGAGVEVGGLSLEPMESGGLPTDLQRMFDGIVLELQRSLDYYESHFSLPPVAGVVMVPTEEAVPGLLGYLAGNLGVPVRMLDLNALLEVDEPLSDALQARAFLAIGAALRREEQVL